MGLTFRGEKGSPLLHTELDNNFREFFYSASVSGSDLLMFRSRSLDNTVTLPLSYPKGGEYAIQLKKGNAPSGSSTSFSGSQNLIYDFRENTTKVSGSLIISSSRVTTPFQVQGSGSITGDLVVGGKVTAEEFITEYTTVAVSTIFKSGSTKFGDTLDDTHTFIGDTTITGSLTVSGSTFKNIGFLEQTGSVDILGNIGIVGNTTQIGSIEHSGSINTVGLVTMSGDVDILGRVDVVGTSSIAGRLEHVGDYIINGDIEQTGDYTQRGNLDLAGFKVNSNELTASNSITVGSFTTLSGSGAFPSSSTGTPILILAGPNNHPTSSQIIFADSRGVPQPYYGGIGIRYDSQNNTLNFDRNDNPDDGGFTNQVLFSLSRDGDVSITGDTTISGSLILQNPTGDTVFTGSLVVTELLSGSSANIDNGLQAGSLTGSIDASNLENVPYAVTASNTFYGDQNVVGDVTASNLDVSGNTLIEGNLTVNGTGSFAVIQSVTGSAKIIGDAFIQLNENTPTERYAGIQVVDSGSIFSTASFFFDGLENNWMYEYNNDETEYALALFGPEFATKGAPVSLTQDTVPIASGSHHLIDSDILNDTVKIRLNKNTQVTGSLGVTGNITGDLIGNADTSTTASAVDFNDGLTTTSDVQFNSLGVGTAAPTTTGLIRATNDIVAFYSSDERLKDNIVQISNPIEKVKKIKGVEFDWNDKQEVYEGHDVGVLAQDIEKVLPELVTTRDNGYKAVKYEKIIALLIEAVKDQQSQIDELKSKL
tara:strand:+ start:207 stop:2501 length:2295 start_codon:yes stop_codon:yes gene_type:complete